MTLTKAGEAAFNAAVEALYAIGNAAISLELQEAAKDDYEREQREYSRLTSERWWEGQCNEFPDCPQCKEYDC